MELVMAEFLMRRRSRRRYYYDDFDDSSSLGTDDSDDDALSITSIIPSWQTIDKMDTTDSLYKTEDAAEPRAVRLLLDRASEVTAQVTSCAILESHMPPLDENMLIMVAYWAFPQDLELMKLFASLSSKTDEEWKKGERLVKEGRVRDVRQVGFMVTSVICTKSGRGQLDEIEQKVSITFEKQRITSSSCTVCQNQVWCPHIIATVIYRIIYPKKVPVHAPVTETLSTLSRDQLQKLVQYAINEDPSGILGKVFMRIDQIRDVSSAENASRGAPDPTFGTNFDGQSHWELTLDEMEKNLMSEFKYGGTFHDFADTYDERARVDCSMYKHYLQRVVDLVLTGEVETAGRVLYVIGTALFKLMEGNGGYGAWKLKSVLHEVCKMWSRYIVFFKGENRDKLIKAAQEHNRNASLSVTYQKDSKWAEAPSVTVMHNCQDLGSEVTKGRPTSPFYETLCASLLPDPPAAYRELLEGKISPLEGGYIEPVPVMLLRLAAIRQWNKISLMDVKRQICQLGVVILHKLISLTKKHSIMHGKEETKYFSETAGPSNVYSDGPPRKRRRRTRYKEKKMEVVKDLETSAQLEIEEEKSEGMSKEQMAYSLLYVSHLVHSSKIYDMDAYSWYVLITATLQGLEMSRYRLIAPPDTVAAKEHCWLQTLENQLVTYLQEVSLSTTAKEEKEKICAKFILQLLSQGLDFYKGAIPVVLMYALVKCSPEWDKNALQLCVNMMCHSTNPFGSFTIRHLEITSYLTYRTEYQKHFENLISCLEQTMNLFFSRVNKTQESMLMKLLYHLERIVDADIMYMMYKVLEANQFRLNSKNHKVMCTRILLHCIRQYNKDQSWRQFSLLTSSILDFLLLLSRDLNIKFLKLVLPHWADLSRFFSGTKLKVLTEKMKEHFTKSAIPRDLIQMLFKYFESNCMHDEESCELLTFFEAGDESYMGALQKISANAANYTARALLFVAQLENGRLEGVSTTPDVFSKEVHCLILRALQRLEIEKKGKTSRLEWSISNSSVNSYLKWVFSCLSKKPESDILKGEQFSEITDQMVKTFPDDPEIYLSFFRSIDSCKALLNKAKEKLGSALLETYKNHFTNVLSYSNHSAYPGILREMNQAYQNCKQFVENGELSFIGVLRHIRDCNRGKKKLLRMMEQDFPNLVFRKNHKQSVKDK
ncbi:hypothetical protein CHS0354_024928 [Potamilus streckersoni]|uniref:Uncharacterized protein n=1 Tax=Potamilus streckersoni TaxID=2493646 RepID=A0AAE0VP21_9BIVA|nr:hypothetical protein CHS0354_024928 [Potamilus streckersoni]